MIQAVSRFRVKNAMEAAVRDAFFDRPHLVDHVAGFLGMEVFTDGEDPSTFYLHTRWTDVDSYRRWHASDAHRLSHREIPRGLKLDTAATQILILHRIHDSRRPLDFVEVAADTSPLLAHHLELTQVVYLIVATLDGAIRGCNAAVATLLKIPTEQLIGKSLWQFLVDVDAETFRRRVQSAARDQRDRFYLNVLDTRNVPYTIECVLDVQPDGLILLGESPKKQDEALHEEMSELNNELAVLMRENSRKSRELKKALDDLKEAQARLVHQEKMASLGLLTAGIAHEINNPIAFVRNNQSTLQRDFEDLLGLVNIVGDSLSELAAACPAVADRILQKAQEIDLSYLSASVPKKIADNLDGLERVKRIVLDLRNYSRLDEGEVKACDVAEGIRSGLKFISPILEAQHVTLVTHFPPLPLVVCAPGPLNQAVSNIIVNAVQASQAGQKVKVSTAQESEFYVITIEDEGSGISLENLPKVFDPFFTTKPVGSGTGLGLSIAHQVIQAHRGEIRVTSEIGKGTTVRLRIPLHPATVGEPAITSSTKILK